MLGKYTLTLNEATVMAALQMYLDSLLKDGAARPQVESVAATSNNYAARAFTVEMVVAAPAGSEG